MLQTSQSTCFVSGCFDKPGKILGKDYFIDHSTIKVKKMTATINHKLIKADSNQWSFCSVKHYISPCRPHSLLLHQLTVSWAKKKTLKHGVQFELSAPHSSLQQLLNTKCCYLLVELLALPPLQQPPPYQSTHDAMGLYGLVCWIYMFNISEYVSALLLLAELTVLPPTV